MTDRFMDTTDLFQTEHFLIQWRKTELNKSPAFSIQVGENTTLDLGNRVVVTGFSPSGLKKAAAYPGESDGSFAYCRYDEHDRLIVGTDRYGLAPLYYTGGNDWLIASTKLSMLQSCLEKAKPDVEALKQLSDLGEILGSRTILEDVSRLRQGEWIVVAGSSWQVETWWQLELDEPLPVNSYLEVTENALRDFLTRNAQIAGENLVCPITGGDDSRRIAFACSQIGIKPKSYTQLVSRGKGHDEDTEIAKQISKTLGLEHYIVSPPDAKTLVKHTVEVMKLTNGESLQHHWAFSLAKEIKPGSIILDGLAAGVLNNGHFVRKYSEHVDCWKDIDRVTDVVSRGFRHHSTKKAVKEELSRLPEHESRLNLFFLFNHTRRNIGSWQQIFWKFGQAPIAPFFQPPLFEQALRLSLKDALETSPHELAMSFYYPQALNIPSTRRFVPNEFYTDLNKNHMRYLRALAAFTKAHPLACEVYDIRKNVAECIRILKCLDAPFIAWWRIKSVLQMSLLIDSTLNDNDL